MTGDVEARGERALLEVDASALRADVLLVPHHGSRTSSTSAFVNAVSTRVAIFTPDYRNRYGHARADVVARYTLIGALRPRTDLDGAITVAVEEGTLDMRREREHRRRYWYDPPLAEASAVE